MIGSAPGAAGVTGFAAGVGALVPVVIPGPEVAGFAVGLGACNGRFPIKLGWAETFC